MNHHSVSSPFVWQPATKTSRAENTASTQPQPLSGARLAVKDLFHISGTPTTAGNPDWLASHAQTSETASAVTKLINAGAKLAGKTITDELAYSLNGQNIHYGTPINPVTPERLPGGSSSGSAVAVSAGLADIGLGTDTGGSIRVPASYNGLFGMRPTHGRISADGLVALAPGFDTVGVMCETLTELENSMQCLFDEPAGYTPELTSLVVYQNAIDSCEHADAAQQWLSALPVATTQGDFSALEQLPLAETFRVLQGREIWRTHGEWISTINPTFAPDIAERFNQSAQITDAEVASAKGIQQQVRELMGTLLAEQKAIVLPTTPGCAPLLSATPAALTDYRKQLLSLTALAGLAGLPQLHLPLFRLNDAPCGLSLIGPAKSEAALFALARTLTE
ncbi:amidase [Alteromonas lipolytica]|uniref:Amidase domain-containing protein n=1 Tax=Alteromonas lipolytica TaxID=1856405 RepID=A0A1E8FL94_9ALTE|nr:amidase [Alteromonas lipolytica]OFI36388.1 hypothetical protein BFC17_00465 [Alteromonas lipolytica]GGF70316.1 amidase [Alteromonas lipolytica]